MAVFTHNQGNTKYMIVEWKSSLKQYTVGQLRIKNYTFWKSWKF